MSVNLLLMKAPLVPIARRFSSLLLVVAVVTVCVGFFVESGLDLQARPSGSVIQTSILPSYPNSLLAISERVVPLDKYLALEHDKDILNGILVFLITIIPFVAFWGWSQWRKYKLAMSILETRNTEIELANARLEEVVEAKDKLFSIIAHDLKGPINSFATMPDVIDFMVEQNDLPGIKEMTTSYRKTLFQVTTMLDSLLNWAFANSGHIKPELRQVALYGVAHQVFDLYTEALGRKNLTPQVVIASDLMVHTDPDCLITVIRNAVNNAIKFTIPGRGLTIAADAIGDMVEIKVIDEGIGMTREQLAKLFTVDRRKRGIGTEGERGSGLGMLLMKDMMELLDGSINVESEPGKGTTVILRLANAA
jgi:signal transduction histidine kinase